MLYNYKSHSTLIQFNFTAASLDTFCGGALLTRFRIAPNSFPCGLYKGDWYKATKKARIEYLEEYFDQVNLAMKEFTEYIQQKGDISIIDSSPDKGLHTRVSNDILRGGYEEKKVVLAGSHFWKAIIVIADAINGESNNAFQITPHSLTVNNPAWSPVSEVALSNPNSGRPVNMWTLKTRVPSEEHSRNYNIIDNFNYLIQCGEL